MRSPLGPGGVAILCLVASRGCDDTTEVRGAGFSPATYRYVAPGTALAVAGVWGTVTTGQACNEDTLDYDDFTDLDQYDYASAFRCTGAPCELLEADGAETGVSMPDDGQWYPAALARPLEPGTLVVEAQLILDGASWDGRVDRTRAIEIVEPTALEVRIGECLDGACTVTSAASATGRAIAVAIAARYGTEPMVAAPDEVTATPPVGLRCGIRAATVQDETYDCYVDATDQTVTVEARWGQVVGRVVIPPTASAPAAEEPTDLHPPP